MMMTRILLQNILVQSDFTSTIALAKHKYQVHNKMLKICDVCGKTCTSQKALYDHKRDHRKMECDVCFKAIPVHNFKRHRSNCHKIPDTEPPEIYQCHLCNFSSELKSCLTKHIKKEHEKPPKLQCTKCDYSTTKKSNLNRHFNYVHLTVKEKCDSCKEGI